MSSDTSRCDVQPDSSSPIPNGFFAGSLGGQRNVARTTCGPRASSRGQRSPAASSSVTDASASSHDSRNSFAEDARHEIPPLDHFPARYSRPTPYIFSEQGIAKVLLTAEKLPPAGSLRPLTFTTMFGLMAVTGIRRKEAIELRLGDFTGNGLHIRQTKFRKSRLIPLHSSTIAVLERYLDARRLVSAETDHLFVSLRRRKLAGHTVLTTFHQVCREAGVGRTHTGTLPRLHDLRHSFAVHALQRCRVSRDQVNRHLLALTTYLGHARVESTYWYLESTPQLLLDIASACENFTVGGQT